MKGATLSQSHEFRHHDLDFLRVLSMLAVIVIHAAAPFIARSGGHNSQFTVAVIYDSFSRFCVPMFVMLSGALMFGFQGEIDKNKWAYYKKKLLRFGPALVFWIIFYWVFSGKMQGIIAGMTIWEILKNAWWVLLNDVPHYHLWYIYMLPGLFLIAPWLRQLKERFTTKQWAIFGIVLLLFGVLHNGWRIYAGTNLPRYYEFIDFIGYLVLGDVFLNMKFPKKFAVFGYVSGSALLAVVIYYYTLWHPGQFFFDSFLSPFIVLPTLSLYVLINQGFEFAKSKVIYELAITSFGIYLVHAAVIDKLMWMTNFTLSPWPFVDIFLYTMATLALSYSVVKILKSTIFSRWLV